MPARVSVLFFDMNSFFASVAQAEEPILIGRPVGVLTTDAPGAACIAASVEAKRKGVGMGTRQEEARQLCPGIVFRVVKHDVCVRYHHAILTAVDRIIPSHRAWSIDECSCLLKGSQQDPDTALRLARDLQVAILSRISPALRCSVGLGPNRFLAKVAAGLEKPGGIHWLLPAVLPEKIAHLALDDLPGVSWRMRARLEKAGIRDIAALHAMDPKEAHAPWGSVGGERFVRELNGEAAVWPNAKRGMIGHGQVLTAANRTPEGARVVARRLLVKAAARLRREGFSARSLSVGLKCARHGRQGCDGQIKATQDTLFLLRTFDRYWARLPVEHPLAVQVTLGGLIRADEVMRDLFDPPLLPAPEVRQMNLCRAVDALNQRFGQDTVRFGQLPPQRVPHTGAKIAFGRIPVVEDFLE